MSNETFSLSTEDVQQNQGSNSASDKLQETKTKFRERKPRADKGQSRKQLQQQQVQQQAMEIDKMLTPENMEALVCLPGDIGLAVTGRSLWQLEDKEVGALSSTAAAAGKYFWQHDPKWLALAMFAANFGMVYGTRAVLNLREARKEAALKAAGAKAEPKKEGV